MSISKNRVLSGIRAAKKCIVLIDGSNFYFKLKDLKLYDLLKFDFSGFIKMLSGKDKVVSTTYYVGKIRTGGTEKSRRLQANQQKLFAHLKKHKMRYSLGYLMKSNRKYHEKGVDVAMAVDMLVATYEKLSDRIILVSSDTDLLPAIFKAKEKGVFIEYIGFSHQPSVAMVAECSQSRLFTREDLLQFIKTQKGLQTP
jgi:uncharacterized LabA/DUF88 family protein